MEKKVIDWVNHEHPLILTENVSTGKTSNCYGCGIPVIDLEVAYVCTVQNCSDRIILHKKCGELPSQILHPKHPQHPLHLFDYHKFFGSWCDVCLCYIDEGLGYRCLSCDFQVDLRCEKIRVDDRLEGKIQVEHPSHPDHPLTLIRKASFSFYCNGCGVKDVDMAYICSTCEFMVHKTCASLPIILPINLRYHHHHLSLAFSFPMDHHRYIRDCDVCYKLLDKTCWVYFCGDCRFFAHIKCVAPTNAETAEQDSNSDGDDNDGFDVIRFPLHAHDISKELIEPFVVREKGLNNIPDVADMPAEVHMPQTTASFSFLFNYHNHPLRLVSELSKKDDEVDRNKMMDERDEDDEYDELKVCDVCVTPILSPPYYECAPCKYFVHSICYLLPKTLSSSSSSHLYGDCPKTHDKNHKLTLYTSSRSIDMDPELCRCEACNDITNGMVYECEGCEMKIDVKCASLPKTIRHASHPHRAPLVLTRIPPAGEEKAGKLKSCCCCRSLMDDRIAYCCSSNDCDFALDLTCGMLPASITMCEWDKYHSLMMLFDASLDHPSGFVCDFCEVELHPKGWMYHCRQCDVSFHLFCLNNASGGYRNIKFGRRFVLDGIHPNHPLTFNHITIKRRCDLCHVVLYDYCGLECASCYYVVCVYCAMTELAKMM
ncbi:uncharacterized protein LOC125207261 [Salvia hispanica]|uniref:uncharacterized protein LOC125207261 n=1 Tax=Salvia hispanica TaxID=49212 RepID=UPI002009524B|nr:uncharacterized protein LOC125207261 [Salvia hispanica]